MQAQQASSGDEVGVSGNHDAVVAKSSFEQRIASWLHLEHNGADPNTWNPKGGNPIPPLSGRIRYLTSQVALAFKVVSPQERAAS